MKKEIEPIMKKNDVIELEIEDMSVDGAGIGRYTGQVVFINNALLGERVRAKVIKAKKNYSIALLLEVLIRSQHRVQPFCGVFGKCGGCMLQHLDYGQQLVYKANFIKQCISRLGGTDISVPEVFPSDETQVYRNKASFPVKEIDGKVQAGFYAPHSHRLIPSDCPIQQPKVNEIKNVIIEWANKKGIKAYDESTGSGILRHIIARQTSKGELMAGIVVTKPAADKDLIIALKEINGLKCAAENINAESTNAIFGSRTKIIYGEDHITERYENLEFRVSLTSFLQINYTQTQKLYELALMFADIKKTDIVFDLFCGIGTISLLAAKRAKRVIGIEYLKQAADDAADNAKLNGITNAEFISGDAAKMLDEAVNLAGYPNIVILDPPRKGCEAALIEKLGALTPLKIVYVSCDPATLARDTALFRDKGYVLSDIKGVDMFPHTPHVETVVSLKRV